MAGAWHVTTDTSGVRRMCLTCLTGHAPAVAPARSAFPRCEILSSLVPKISLPTWTSNTVVCQVKKTFHSEIHQSINHLQYSFFQARSYGALEGQLPQIVSLPPPHSRNASPKTCAWFLLHASLVLCVYTCIYAYFNSGVFIVLIASLPRLCNRIRPFHYCFIRTISWLIGLRAVLYVGAIAATVTNRITKWITRWTIVYSSWRPVIPQNALLYTTSIRIWILIFHKVV